MRGGRWSSNGAQAVQWGDVSGPNIGTRHAVTSCSRYSSTGSFRFVLVNFVAHFTGTLNTVVILVSHCIISTYMFVSLFCA